MLPSTPTPTCKTPKIWYISTDEDKKQKQVLCAPKKALNLT